MSFLARSTGTRGDGSKPRDDAVRGVRYPLEPEVGLRRAVTHHRARVQCRCNHARSHRFSTSRICKRKCIYIIGLRVHRAGAGMVRSIAARSEQRWRASPGVVKALLEQRDIVAADAQAHARTPVGSSAVASSAFDGKVVPTQRDRLDDEDVAILGRRAEEIIPDLSQLMSVHTVVKVKECVRRWRAKVQSQLPPPERKSINRMGQFVADGDNVLVTTCDGQREARHGRPGRGAMPAPARL